MKNLFFTIIFFISGCTLAQKVKVLDQQTGKIVKNTNPKTATVVKKT